MRFVNTEILAVMGAGFEISTVVGAGCEILTVMGAGCGISNVCLQIVKYRVCVYRL